MKAKSIKGKSTEEISSALIESIADGFKPTLAVVFLSIQQDYKAISELLDKKGIALFGATTAGEFIDGELEEESAVIMLLDLNSEYFVISFHESHKDLRESAHNVGALGNTIFTKPAFVVAVAGFGPYGETAAQGIQEVMQESATIFGGVAGDDNTGKGAYVFSNNSMTKKGMVALIIDSEKVDIKGIAVSGWRPIGTERTITKSEANLVYTIDDQPALDILTKYLNDAPTDLVLEDNTVVLGNNELYPILVHREDAPSVVRAAIRTDPVAKSVHFAGLVPEGSRFHFTIPPDFDFIPEVIKQVDTELKKKIPVADALILFSCISRKGIFGPLVSEEIEGLKNLWQAPLVGFFSYGEIGKVYGGNHEYHNNTCCLVVMKETVSH